MDVMRFKNDEFNIAVDAEVDQDDKRLHQELKQLIAEHFEDFDLGDDADIASDSHCTSNDEADESDENKPDLNTEELASINAAGKLSLLENAIQRFGDDDTHASEDTLTDKLPTYSSQPVEAFQSNLPIQISFNPPSAMGSCNSNKQKGARDAEPWVITSGTQGHIEATKTPTVIKKDCHRLPYFVDETVDWESNLPSEVGNEMFMLLQKNRTAEVSSAQATGRPMHQTGPDTAVSAVETCVRTSSPTATSSTLPRPSSGLSTDTANWSRVGSSLQRPTNISPNITINEAFEKVPPWTVNECSSSVSEGYVQTITDLEGIKSQSVHHYDSAQLPLNPDERRDLLYAARGRQLEQLTAEVARLREEVAKEKRLANHRATLAEGERETLSSKLNSSEQLILSLRKELQEHEDQIGKLRRRLTESETSNSQLNSEVNNLRSTNESLSTQLVELTTGNALRRAEAREDKLTEALERRYAVVAEEVKEELNIANKRLVEKEKEIANLQRQVEVYKSDLKKAQEDFADSLRRANQQLEESQQHCQKLASSVLCSEVTTLRQKVSDFEMSKKISDDVNAILQDELRDLREQVVIYERMLRLDEVAADELAHEDRVEYRPSSRGQRDCDNLDRKDQLCDLGVSHSSETHSHKLRPTSMPENQGAEHRGPEECSRLCNDMIMDGSRRRAHFACSDPSLSAEQIRAMSTITEVGPDGFQSLTRQGVLTSTPAPSRSAIAQLKTELERCLANYKEKREQITKLHETLFTTRCQLHQATDAARKAEKNATELQDRVLSLERELASNRELNDTPGPREAALSGQLDRLKVDYAKLEEELQSTRTRLQTALGAEARALENEKTASERLAASTAERDAAVDRARAVCEAHYTSMRRRLEMDWANERESLEQIAEERLNKVRQELSECQAKLNQMTQLYRDAERSTQEAVETALREAMQEREAERMRFWREELPQQLESARTAWEHEWSEQHIAAVHQAVVDCEKRLHPSRPVDVERNYSEQATLPMKKTSHVETNTEQLVNVDCAAQTDIETLVSVSAPDSGSSKDPNESVVDTGAAASGEGFQVLHKFLSTSDLRSLRIQLLETSALNMNCLDRRFHAFLKRRCKFYTEQSWRLVALSMNKLFDEYQLEGIISATIGPSVDLSAVKEMLGTTASDMASPGFDESAQPTAFSPIHRASENFSDSELAELHHPSSSHNTKPYSVRDKVLLRLRQLAQALYHLHGELDTAQYNLRKVNQIPTSPNRVNSELYDATLRKIKQEVLQYVQTCQARAAETLHSELARVHQRACRQFTVQLRRALYEARASNVTPSETRVMFPRKSIVHLPFKPTCPMPTGRDLSESGEQTASLGSNHSRNIGRLNMRSEPVLSGSSTSFESLLHMIDKVCASTEKAFRPDTSISAHLFDQSVSVESPNPSEFTQVIDPVATIISPLKPKSSAARAGVPRSTSDFKPMAKSDCESRATISRKIPRTRAKLAWIRMQSPRSLSANLSCQSRDSDEEFEEEFNQIPASIPTSKSETILERPVVFLPVSADLRHSKPVPAPRVAKLVRPGSEPLYPSGSVITGDHSELTNHPPYLGTEGGRSRRVCTELYNLFEQFNTPEK